MKFWQGVRAALAAVAGAVVGAVRGIVEPLKAGWEKFKSLDWKAKVGVVLGVVVCVVVGVLIPPVGAAFVTAGIATAATLAGAGAIVGAKRAWDAAAENQNPVFGTGLKEAIQQSKILHNDSLLGGAINQFNNWRNNVQSATPPSAPNVSRQSSSSQVLEEQERQPLVSERARRRKQETKHPVDSARYPQSG